MIDSKKKIEECVGGCERRGRGREKERQRVSERERTSEKKGKNCDREREREIEGKNSFTNLLRLMNVEPSRAEILLPRRSNFSRCL